MKRLLLGSLLSCMLVGQVSCGENNQVNQFNNIVKYTFPRIGATSCAVGAVAFLAHPLSFGILPECGFLKSTCVTASVITAGISAVAIHDKFTTVDGFPPAAYGMITSGALVASTAYVAHALID